MFGTVVRAVIYATGALATPRVRNQYPLSGANVIDLGTHSLDNSHAFVAKNTGRVQHLHGFEVGETYATCLYPNTYLSSARVIYLDGQELIRPMLCLQNSGSRNGWHEYSFIGSAR
jgi:hypothetical protein